MSGSNKKVRTVHWVNHFEQITKANDRVSEMEKEKNTVVENNNSGNNGLFERVINFVSNKLGS